VDKAIQTFNHKDLHQANLEKYYFAIIGSFNKKNKEDRGISMKVRIK